METSRTSQRQRLDFTQGMTYYQIAISQAQRERMLKSYISQHCKETVLNTCIIAAILWLLIKLLACLAQSSLIWFSSTVLMPALSLVVIGFLMKYAMSLWNYVIFTQTYNSLLHSISNHQFKRLDKDEKQKILFVLRTLDFSNTLKKWIEKGYRGGYFTKKAHSKERKPNGELQPRSSSFGHQWIKELPRKIWIGFKGSSANNDMTVNLINNNGYRDLKLELHICHNSKTAGGGKLSLYPNGIKSRGTAETDTCHPNKTVVGSYKVCHFTEVVGSDGTSASGVALGVRAACKSGGPLYSYALEKSHGQSLAGLLYRHYYLKKNDLRESDDIGKSSQVTKDFVIKLLQEVTDQLRPLHQRGVCHGDLKAENICVDNQQKCRVIDFPDETEDYSWTRELCQLTNTHWLLAHVVTQNHYSMTEGAEIRWGRECNIPLEIRRDLEKITAEFEKRGEPRACLQKSTSPATQLFTIRPKNNQKYLDVYKNSLYQDTWSLLYMAFITFGELQNKTQKDFFQQKVFSIMADMVKSYIRHYNDAKKVDKPSIIAKMNQDWPLKETIDRVIECYTSKHTKPGYQPNKMAGQKEKRRPKYA